MSARPYSFDTNILVYALDTNAGDRHIRARRMIALANPFRLVILLQTLGELCSAVSRKRPALLPTAHDTAIELANIFEVKSPTAADLKEGISAQQQHGLSFWDAMLWATAHRSGCSLLFTEDLQDGRTLGSVTFRNPFLLSEASLSELLR